MIKEKDLREMRPQVRYKDGQSITLQTVQNAIRDCAQANGIPVAFKADQIKYGGLIGGSVVDCIVLYHPEHEKDYFNLAIQVKHQGNYAFISVNDFGTSKLLGNEGSHEFLMDTLKHGSGSEKVGALVGAGIRRMVKGGAQHSEARRRAKLVQHGFRHFRRNHRLAKYLRMQWVA